MSTAEVLVVVIGWVAAGTLMTALMIHANDRELRSMDRRRREWIANGSVPEDEPNFFAGNGG